MSKSSCLLSEASKESPQRRLAGGLLSALPGFSHHQVIHLGTAIQGVRKYWQAHYMTDGRVWIPSGNVV